MSLPSFSPGHHPSERSMSVINLEFQIPKNPSPTPACGHHRFHERLSFRIGLVAAFMWPLIEIACVAYHARDTTQRHSRPPAPRRHADPVNVAARARFQRRLRVFPARRRRCTEGMWTFPADWSPVRRKRDLSAISCTRV